MERRSAFSLLGFRPHCDHFQPFKGGSPIVTGGCLGEGTTLSISAAANWMQGNNVLLDSYLVLYFVGLPYYGLNSIGPQSPLVPRLLLWAFTRQARPALPPFSEELSVAVHGRADITVPVGLRDDRTIARIPNPSAPSFPEPVGKSGNCMLESRATFGYGPRPVLYGALGAASLGHAESLSDLCTVPHRSNRISALFPLRHASGQVFCSHVPRVASDATGTSERGSLLADSASCWSRRKPWQGDPSRSAQERGRQARGRPADGRLEAANARQ